MAEQQPFLCDGRIVLGAMDARAHEEADDLVALLFQQVGGDGAIDPAAHGQDDSTGHV